MQHSFRKVCTVCLPVFMCTHACHPRLLHPPSTATMQIHVANYLTPFVDDIRPHLLSQNFDFTHAPFAGFCATVVKMFMDDVLGVKPPDSTIPRSQLEVFGCGCEDCLEVKAFLLSSIPDKVFRKVGGVRTHLEKQLAQLKTQGVSVSTETHGRPYSLRVSV